MPTEIADSDAESDFEVQPTPPRVPDHTHEELKRATTCTFDGTIDVNFDDFISQTQSIARPSASPSEPTNARSTSSTIKLLNGIQDAQIGLAASGNDRPINGYDTSYQILDESRRKRSVTDVDGSPALLRQGGGEAVQSRMKRSKTSEAGSRHLTSSQDMYSNSRNEDEPHKSLVGAAVEEDEGVGPRQWTGPLTTVSLRRDSDPNLHMVITTSRSSMGGHESITLDLRGSGKGMDVNPFGSPSQTSVDGGHRLSDPEVLDRDDFDSGKPSSTALLTASEQQLADAADPLNASDDHSLTITERSRSRSRSVDLSLVMLDPLHNTQLLTPFDATSSWKKPESNKAKAETCDNYLNTEEEMDLPTLTVDHTSFESTMVRKKCGHKARGSRRSSARFTPDLVEQEETRPDNFTVRVPRAQNRPEISRDRNGMADPQAELVENEREAPYKKVRKRSLKAPAADLRPSSPAKQPTSELNLSDEAMIGLPKENYKPRPSRRRSKIIAEEDGSIVTQAEPQLDVIETRQEAVLMAKEAKKGKKLKIKRAKTSAIALVKKSEPMVSDGEEDVLWLDTKPATVKFHQAPDPLTSRAVKKEDIVGVESTIDEENMLWPGGREHPARPSNLESAETAETQTRETPNLTGKITIEIPAAKNPPKEPKKRSGTRKTTAEATDEAKGEPIALDATTTSVQPQRPALSDIESNVPRLPSSPAHRKLENSMRAAKSPTNAAGLADDGKVDNETSSTPSRNQLALAATDPAAASSSSSSPTKSSRQTHSPINPTGGKVIYRIGLSRHRPIPPLLKMVKKPEPKGKATVKSDDDAVRQTLEIYRKSGLLDS